MGILGAWMAEEEKPTAPFALSLVGAVLIVINGGVMAALGEFLDIFFPGAALLYAAVGISLGAVGLLAALMLYVRPQQCLVWSIVVLVVSALSLIVGGGFFIGFILGLMGGILGVVWKPSEPMTRTCMRCGRQVPLEYYICPYCGHVFPMVPRYGPAVPGTPPQPPVQP